MKILCLHGNGMSGALLAVQTSTFRRLLGDEHEYVFLDGQIESDCVIGLEEISKGPYFRWNIELTSREILAAHEYIRTVMDEDGPFDGVMGFSQGSALAASMLLQHEIDHPKETPPFSFAIFFSCFLVVSPDEKFAQKKYEIAHKEHIDAALKGLNASIGDNNQDDEADSAQNVNENNTRGEKKPKKDVKAPNHRIELLRSSKRAALVTEIVDVVASSARTGTAYHGEVGTSLPTDASEGFEGFPRVFHPLIMTERIRIPTVHIVGKSDPFMKQTDIAKRLWAKDSMRYIEHSGGHDVPRLERDVRAAVESARWAIQRSQISSNRGWHLQV